MNKKKIYAAGFAIPALLAYSIFFILPTIMSFFFSLTVWDFEGFTFCGLKNFQMFLSDSSLYSSISHTLIYALLTSGAKLLLGFCIALFLTSYIKTKNILRAVIYFPNLVSTIAVGITFKVLMHPSRGLINSVLEVLHLPTPDWLGDIKLALFSVAGVDVWKGVGIATIIFIAGIESIDSSYLEAASIDGATWWQKVRYITLPLSASSRNSIIILSLIGGLRAFDLIWSMTGGGPGFASDVLASVIYKQYASGYYGLSTAGNVVMLVLVAAIGFPLQKILRSKEEEIA